MSSLSFATPKHRSRRFLGALIGAAAVIAVTAAPALADVSFINSSRASAGLPPVSDNASLASVARNHSADMASQGTLFHTGNLAGAIGSVISGWQAIGENVGVGSSVAEVNSMFMQSSAHRANILGNVNVAAVGVVTGSDGRVWVTQMFARVATATAPRVTTTTAPRVATTTADRPTSQVRASRSAPRTELPPPAPPADTPPPAVGGLPGGRNGFRVVAQDGGVFTFGAAGFEGSAADLALSEPIVGGAATPSGQGYVLFGAKGGVFTFGDATYAGSATDEPHAPIVGGAMSRTGQGYVLFARDGGTFSYGDATFAGSAVDLPKNASVVGGARTPTGDGYWLVGADGGIYAFGDAPFLGSAAELGKLSAPIVGMAATPSGKGYWLVASDGGVFAFGDAEYYGSGADQPLPVAVRAIVPTPTGKGYWLIRADREVMPFGMVESPILRRPSLLTHPF
jgi:hypothetical protein